MIVLLLLWAALTLTLLVALTREWVRLIAVALALERARLAALPRIRIFDETEEERRWRQAMLQYRVETYIAMSIQRPTDFVYVVTSIT